MFSSKKREYDVVITINTKKYVCEILLAGQNTTMSLFLQLEILY
jgi:hypothetical protein